MTLRLTLFGSPAVERDATSFALPFERRHQLVAYLALRRAWVGRAELAALLWPDLPDKLAYTNLRKTLFRLSSLPWAPAIASQGSALRFDVDTDVLAFEAALRERRFADALLLRRGELLVGYDDDTSEAWRGWLAFERERLRVAWRGAALERLAGALDASEGIDLSARLLETDPLDEAALRLHMAWLARAGHGARARQAYREFVRRLDDDLGIAPGAELRAVHDALGAAVTASIATSTGASADEGFVGRTVELRRLAALVAQPDCRLVCVTGPGGVGKTRLARRAMADLAARFADGAAFIPLDDLASPGELGSRLARELDVPLAGSGDALEQVVHALRAREMLIVLDNFEQLVHGAALVDGLLDGCPRVKLVVTSRVRLARPGEWLLPLEGLPFPEIEDTDRFESFDAVRLFVQAARRVEPALVPSTEAASILDICRQVEGLPLALELAAAWTRVLSCDAIAAELRQGTELLQDVDGARPARQASIDVVFDQSWRHLATAERDALARLSVFRGGFAPDAARAVAGASLPVLAALADKSLLRKDDGRLAFHPLVQELAAKRLGDGDARADAERAHALYFHRLLARLQRAVEDGDRDALQDLDAEFENARIAWRWAVAHGAEDALARITPTLLNYCDHRGRFVEGLALFGDALAGEGIAAQPALAAILESATAHLEYRLDRYAAATAAASRALAAVRATRDTGTRLLCHKVLGGCALRLGRLDDARRHYQHALELAPPDVDPHQAAALLDNLALVEKAQGRYDEALRLSLASLAQHRRLGDAAGVALCLNNLAALHVDRHDHAAAAMYLREALAIAERHGFVTTVAFAHANLAEIALKEGDDAAAGEHARRAQESATAVGNRGLAAWLGPVFTRLALRRGDHAGARAELASASSIAMDIDRPQAKFACVIAFADLIEALGEAVAARRVLAWIAAHPKTHPLERDEALARLARGTAESGEPPPPAIDLDAFVQRIAIEAPLMHAPLIALLRASANDR